MANSMAILDSILLVFTAVLILEMELIGHKREEPQQKKKARLLKCHGLASGCNFFQRAHSRYIS
eukprot:15152492-Ditylum_brightwellii.AAC.1